MNQSEALRTIRAVLYRIPRDKTDSTIWQYGPRIAKTEEEALAMGITASGSTWLAISQEGRALGLTVDDFGQPCYGEYIGHEAVARAFDLDVQDSIESIDQIAKMSQMAHHSLDHTIHLIDQFLASAE